jgi:CheY-like chemotaxis protein
MDSNKKILIAEDVDSNFLLVKIMLRKYDLTRALNGVEAVDLAKTGQFDLILMDVMMPEMDGIEATKKIREFDQKTPIVALTAVAFEDDKLRCLEAGCNYFLTKPIKMNDLHDTLKKYLGE